MVNCVGCDKNVEIRGEMQTDQWSIVANETHGLPHLPIHNLSSPMKCTNPDNACVGNSTASVSAGMSWPKAASIIVQLREGLQGHF